MKPGQTNRLLGYPADARLLIVNADDFGMCHAVNQAIQRVLAHGQVHSTSLMVPCPWAPEAMHFLASHPEIPFGIHLTAISDPDGYRWRPMAPWDQVPSLVDHTGAFYTFADRHARLAKVQCNELELEFRAQIEAVRTAGLRPTHLDWHALRFGNRDDLFALMVGLAREYGLALRVIGQPAIQRLQNQGLPTIDYDFLDSYGLDPAAKPATYTRLLRELPVGLSEWAVHPGLDYPELLAIEPAGRHERQADTDFWTSQQARDAIRAEGIILLDYRGLQAIWQTR